MAHCAGQVRVRLLLHVVRENLDNRSMLQEEAKQTAIAEASAVFHCLFQLTCGRNIVLTSAAPWAAIMMPTLDSFLTTSFNDSLERSTMTSTSRPVLRAAAITASSLLNTRPFVLH